MGKRLALLDEYPAVDLQQIAALHAFLARNAADKKREVSAFESGLGVRRHGHGIQ